MPRAKGFTTPPPDPTTLLSALYEDVERNGRSLKASGPADLQFWRRNYTRAVFAYLEAYTNWTAHAALDLGRQLAAVGRPVFTPLEECALETRGPNISDAGVVEPRPIAPSFVARFRFVQVAWARSLEKPWAFPSQDPLWTRFRRSIEVRHRITHPTSDSDVQIADDEIDHVHSAFVFFINLLGSMPRA